MKLLITSILQQKAHGNVKFFHHTIHGLMRVNHTSFFCYSTIHMYKLPDLDYKYDALEPHIDEKTMIIHHTMHHRGYVDKLNAHMKTKEIVSDDIITLQVEIDPSDKVLRDNGGGHFNHGLFWMVMTDDKHKRNISNYKHINKRIEDKWGSVEAFYDKFEERALSVFGSGWTWLIVNKNRDLEIVTTSNQDNPLMSRVEGVKKGIPIIALDVWEHAYYLKYQKNRNTYIRAFFNVINWDFVNELSSTFDR